MKRFILVAFSAFLLAIFFISKTAFAEIATVRDWIGLFPVGAADGKANTVTASVTATFADGHMWVYANSCTQTAGATPSLNNPVGCSFALSPVPASGNYEFRLYANDQENPAALISISNAMAAPTPTPGPGEVINCPIQNTNPRVQNGLISTPNISDKFGNPGATCVIGNPAPFAFFNIPGYDAVKSIYFTQSKSPNKTVKTGATLDPIADGYIYNYTNLSGSSTGAAGVVYSYSSTAVVFIDGNLSINGNITGASNVGLVLVVGGKITIASGVTRIDAVLISAGKIYTADADCSHTSPVTASQLIVNGSLISLDATNNIEFCRTLLTGNINPAELINNQPKYLVILRSLYSASWQKWSEIQ